MRADTSEASLREALGLGDRDEGSCPAEEAPLLLYPFPEAEYLEVCPANPLPIGAANGTEGVAPKLSEAPISTRGAPIPPSRYKSLA